MPLGLYMAFLTLWLRNRFLLRSCNRPSATLASCSFCLQGLSLLSRDPSDTELSEPLVLCEGEDNCSHCHGHCSHRWHHRDTPGLQLRGGDVTPALTGAQPRPQQCIHLCQALLELCDGASVIVTAVWGCCWLQSPTYLGWIGVTEV